MEIALGDFHNSLDTPDQDRHKTIKKVTVISHPAGFPYNEPNLALDRRRDEK